MRSPLERTAVAVSQLRHPRLTACLLGLLFLCAAGVYAGLGGAVAANGLQAGRSATSAAATLLDKAISALVGFALAEHGADQGGQSASATEDEAALVAVEVAESQEEIVDAPELPDFGWLASPRENQTPRRPDPIVERRCVLIAPTRAPPAVAPTVV